MNDEEQWDGSALVRALRAPGTQQELAGEDDAVAAFRAARRRRGARLRRLGIGGTTAALVIGLSGGVAAAAYTNALPDPAQHLAHRALGSLGVPDTSVSTKEVLAPTPGAPGGEGHQDPDLPAPGGTEPSSPASTVPDPTADPTTDPTRAATDPASSAPTESTPSAPSSPSPTARPDRNPPAARVTASASALRVGQGASVSIRVTVTSTAGGAWADGPLKLVAKPADGSRRAVVHTRTDDRGSAAINTPAILRTTRFWVGAKGAHSDGIRVVVVPDLEARYSDGQIRVSTGEAWAGDTVTVSTRRDGVVAWLTVDSSGEAVLPMTPTRHAVRYAIRLPATPAHANAHTVVTVPRAAGRADRSGSSAPSASAAPRSPPATPSRPPSTHSSASPRSPGPPRRFPGTAPHTTP